MRKQNWPELLNNYLAQDHVFDWANNNCAHFAFGAAEAMTGIDLVAHYNGPKTKKGMIAKLRRVCGGDVEAGATKEIGKPYSAILMAKRGDIVSFDFGDGAALGICIGAKVVFLTENDGIGHLPLKDCRFAWGVN